MSKKVLLLTCLVMVSAMTIFETFWIDESSWAWLITGILLMATLYLFYLFTKESNWRIKRIHTVALIAGFLAIVAVANVLVPTANDAKRLLGIDVPDVPFPSFSPRPPGPLTPDRGRSLTGQ